MCYSLWYNAPTMLPANGRQHRGCIIPQISDNEMYLLIKYIKSVLWRVSKCLSYIEEARCLKVNVKRRAAAQTAAVARLVYRTAVPV